MRVIRSAGQNVSPADDGRLYSKAFADGLFEDVAITSLGTNLVSIGSLYGIICGRDFTAEAQNINVVLPETEGTTEGVIYVEIDISSDDVITIDSALKPFTPTYEDINMNGAVAQMVIAEYTATPVAVTDVTSVYPVATAGGIGSMATIELSPVQNSYAVGDFLVWKGQLYKVTAAIASGESLVVGTNIEAVTIGSELTALNKGLIQMDLLWTNPSPSASFSPQTISLDLSEYDMVMVSAYAAGPGADSFAFSFIGRNGHLFGQANTRHYRKFSVSASGVAFEAGYSGDANAGVASVNNATQIPQNIYGIKLSD